MFGFRYSVLKETFAIVRVHAGTQANQFTSAINRAGSAYKVDVDVRPKKCLFGYSLIITLCASNLL